MLKKSSSRVFWLSILLWVPYMMWIWSTVIALQKNIPEPDRINITLFKIAVIFPSVYCLFAIVYFFPSGNISMPLHLAAMLSLMYAMLVAAKTIKSVEMSAKATVSDYLGDFFLFLFYPIGIWVLHPRIQNILRGRHLMNQITE